MIDRLMMIEQKNNGMTTDYATDFCCTNKTVLQTNIQATNAVTGMTTTTKSGVKSGAQILSVALLLPLAGCNQEAQVANASVSAPTEVQASKQTGSQPTAQKPEVMLLANGESIVMFKPTSKSTSKSSATVNQSTNNQSVSNSSVTNDSVSDAQSSAVQASNIQQASISPVKQADSINSVLEQTDQFLSSANTLANLDNRHLNFPVKNELRSNVSQQFLGVNDIEQRLMEALPEIEYHTDNLSEFAMQVNNAQWHQGQRLNPALIVKIQALLNWHNHGVGAVDGKFSANTIKAMQAFQKARGLKPTKRMNAITWKLLSADEQLSQQPVLVQYKLTKKDVTIPRYYYRSQYKSVREAVAEKFHMSRAMLYRLNPNTRLKAGNTITVYNPGQPNSILVSRVEVYKKKNLLVAYDDNDKIIASYPTTVGYNSPSGSYHVASRVLKPYYNSDFSNKAGTIPPGPNNPVGLVWLGLSKPSFGIHGSPMPEMISRQRSHGCIRLTNWDALSLYGSIKHRALVQFKNS